MKPPKTDLKPARSTIAGVPLGHAGYIFNTGVTSHDDETDLEYEKLCTYERLVRGG